MRTNFRSILLAVLVGTLMCPYLGAQVSVSAVASPSHFLPLAEPVVKITFQNSGSQDIAFEGSVSLEVTQPGGGAPRFAEIMGRKGVVARPAYFANITAPTIPQGGSLTTYLVPRRAGSSADFFLDPIFLSPGVYSLRIYSNTYQVFSQPFTVTMDTPSGEDAVVVAAVPNLAPTRDGLMYTLGPFAALIQAHPLSTYYKIKRVFQGPVAPAMQNAQVSEFRSLASQPLSGAAKDLARMRLASEERRIANRQAQDGDVDGAVQTAQPVFAELTDLQTSALTDYAKAFATYELGTLPWSHDEFADYGYQARGGPLFADEGQLKPLLDCASPNPDGTYTWYFGYENVSNSSITIAVGSKLNSFSPGPANRSQPSVFSTGVHHGVVTIAGGPATGLVWKLNGYTGEPPFAPTQPPPCVDTIGLGFRTKPSQ